MDSIQVGLLLPLGFALWAALVLGQGGWRDMLRSGMTRNSIHPGNDDVSCCQHTVGDMAGQGEGDDTNKTLCMKYNVEKWAISLTASRA